MGLCPFCGSSNISRNPKYKTWRCNRCEKSFPVPSHGPGGIPQKKSYKRRTTRLPHFLKPRVLGKVLVGLFGIGLFILGAHGIYTYFYPFEGFMALGTGASEKLFFAIEIPVPPIGSTIEWMTGKGVQNWLVPVLATAAGGWLAYMAFKQD